MHNELWQRCLAVANQALPNETCGLFIQSRSNQVVHLLQFPEVATPWYVEAHPQAVIEAAYALFGDAVNEVVVGTFHTHPDGRCTPSAADAGFALWAHVHLILASQVSSHQEDTFPDTGGREWWIPIWWASSLDEYC